MTVEALNCPNCGSSVPGDSTLCEFCKSRLKTVACTSCFAKMFVGSKFCSSCGAIAAPIEPVDSESSGECPRCRKSLEGQQIDETFIKACLGCDGLWIEVRTFEAVCTDRERQSSVLGFLERRTQPGQPMTKVNYVPCPDCGELMNRNNFAKASGVIVDICKQHGVWLDADELPSIIEFIRMGGMELARQREMDALKQERDGLRDERSRVARLDRRSTNAALFEDRETSGIRGFVRSLFS